MDSYKVKLTLTERLLGTVPKSKDIYLDHIIRKAREQGVELTEAQVEQELKTTGEMEEKGWTGFHMLDGNPILYSYVIKGFFKDACGMLRRATGTRSSKVKAYKKVVDGLIFVTPRMIPLILPDGAKMGVLERPLRAQTAQGERVALARSDTCPPGTTLEFTLLVLGVIKEPLLKEWLSYGELRGLGQWRNAGFGRVEYELMK